MKEVTKQPLAGLLWQSKNRATMLQQLLGQKQEEILQRWFELVLQTYPEASGKYLERTKDRFGNPVGYTIESATRAIFEALVGRRSLDDVGPELEALIKIRAVQDFSPSQAVLVVFLLKKTIRELLGEQLSDAALACELLTFEVDIDRMALTAFDLYMENRRKLFDIQVREIKNRTRMLEERLNREAVSQATPQERGKGNDSL